MDRLSVANPGAVCTRVSPSAQHRPFAALAVVAVASGRGGGGGTHALYGPRQYPGTLAGCKSRRKQAIVDLSGDREAIECGRRQEQPRVVSKAVAGRIHIALCCRDDSITRHEWKAALCRY